jgi:hypothetical protein
MISSPGPGTLQLADNFTENSQWSVVNEWQPVEIVRTDDFGNMPLIDH